MNVAELMEDEQVKKINHSKGNLLFSVKDKETGEVSFMCRGSLYHLNPEELKQELEKFGDWEVVNPSISDEEGVEKGILK